MFRTGAVARRWPSPGFEAIEWWAIVGAAGMPRDIVARLDAEINRIRQLPDVQETLAGSPPLPAPACVQSCAIRMAHSIDDGAQEVVSRLTGVNDGTARRPVHGAQWARNYGGASTDVANAVQPTGGTVNSANSAGVQSEQCRYE
jgi:hypothetical protein